MIKFIIVIGQKYFSNYLTQNNHRIIQTKFLTALFKNNIETNENSKFFKHRNDFCDESLKRKIVRIKRCAEKIC